MLISYCYTPHVIKELAVYTVMEKVLLGLTSAVSILWLICLLIEQKIHEKNFCAPLKSHENCKSLSRNFPCLVSHTTTSMIVSSQVNMITVLSLIS